LKRSSVQQVEHGRLKELDREDAGKRPEWIVLPRAWNNFPVDLRLSRTFTIFKTHLKSHLFNLSFPSV